jgi:short-subunit dehydrogenase
MLIIILSCMNASHPADSPFVKRYGAWALVTGASDGIGRAFALELARRGLHVVLVARRTDALEALATQVTRDHAVQARVVAADLGHEAGVEAVLAQTAGLDVGLMVAAAGFGTSGAFLDADPKQELNMVDVNCRAVAALAHHFGKRFAAQRRGGMILMSSLVAFQGVPRAANYAATKAYVQSLAEGLRQELAPLGVDVLASAPGPIHSGFAARANMKMGMALPAGAVAQETLRALGRKGTVRPGWLSKFLELSLAMLPRWGRVRMMGVVMGGMTKHRA